MAGPPEHSGPSERPAGPATDPKCDDGWRPDVTLNVTLTTENYRVFPYIFEKQYTMVYNGELTIFV